MEMNNVEYHREELPADVFSLIRSPEVREFLRKEGDLDIFDKEQIVLHSHISIRQKMAMPKQLADTGNVTVWGGIRCAGAAERKTEDTICIHSVLDRWKMAD